MSQRERIKAVLRNAGVPASRVQLTRKGFRIFPEAGSAAHETAQEALEAAGFTTHDDGGYVVLYVNVQD